MKKTLTILAFTLVFSACSFQEEEQRVSGNTLEGVLYLNEGAKGGPFLQVGSSSYFLDKEQLELALPGYKEMNETLFSITGTTDSHLCAAYEQCLLSGIIHRFETIESVIPNETEEPEESKEAFVHTSFNGFELTFPPEWEGVTENPDRGGFGSDLEHPMVPLIFGHHSTFELDRKARFQITRLSAADQGHTAIPESVEFLGANEEYAFYAEIFDENTEESSAILESFVLLP